MSKEKKIKLANGREVPRELLASVSITIQDLMSDGFYGAFLMTDLHLLCNGDQNIREGQIDELKKHKLLNENGTVDENVANIVLSSFVGQSISLTWVDPCTPRENVPVYHKDVKNVHDSDIGFFPEFPKHSLNTEPGDAWLSRFLAG